MAHVPRPAVHSYPPRLTHGPQGNLTTVQSDVAPQEPHVFVANLNQYLSARGRYKRRRSR